MSSVFAIVPVGDEDLNTVVEYLSTLDKILKRFCLRHEICVVMDDVTPSHVKDYVHDHYGSVVVTGKHGLSACYIAGYVAGVGSDYKYIMEIDIGHDLRYVHNLICADEGRVGFITSNRMDTVQSVYAGSWFRKMVSMIGSDFLAHQLGIPYQDNTGGFYMTLTDVVRKIDLGGFVSRGYFFQSEFKYYVSQIVSDYREIPIEHDTGKSGFRLGSLWQAYIDYRRLRGKIKADKARSEA